MPTSNKTTNLGLNNWLETDKPKRIDFIENNEILDTTIGTHLADTTLHMTDADRKLLSTPFVIGTLVGTGDATYEHTLSFEPKLVIVFLKSYPPILYNSTSQYTVCSSGIAFQGSSSATFGMNLVGSALTLNQTQGTPSNGFFVNLNKFGGQYMYVAFK